MSVCDVLLRGSVICVISLGRVEGGNEVGDALTPKELLCSTWYDVMIELFFFFAFDFD